MIINPCEVNLVLPPPLKPRSEGVHLSGIIRCIAQEQGILTKDDDEVLSLRDVRDIVDPIAVLRISIGLAWEQYYISQVLPAEGVIDHPDEVLLDDIYMSADGMSYNGKAAVIHEAKATYKSTKTVGDLSKQWMWRAQMMGYCKGWNTRFARLHVLFLCNDYQWPMVPSLQVWDIEFTQQELDENWDLMTSYKEYMEGK